MKTWRIANLLLLELGMLSLCAMLKESFALTVPDAIFGWLALICVFLWITNGFRLGFLVGIPLCAGTLLYLWRSLSPDLITELRDVMDHVSVTYFAHYGSSAAVSFAELSKTHFAALLMITVLLSAFTSISLTAGSFRIGLSELATIPLFCVCIAVNGHPSVLPVLGLFLFWAGLQLGGDSYRPDDAGGKASLMGLIPCALLLALTLLFCRPSAYVAEERDFDLSQRFDRLGQMLSDWLDGETITLPGRADSGRLSGWDSKSDRLELSRPYDTSVLSREFFTLTSDLSGSLYLRGRSYGEYDGDSWSAAPVHQGSALSYAAQAASRGGSHYNFELQCSDSYDLLYLPYYSITDGAGDISIPAGGLTAYGGTCYTLQGSSRVLPQSLHAEEEDYRSYVHTYYTRLPDSTRSSLEALCREQNLTADRVADFVRDGSRYDLSIGPCPGDDWAVYFLTVSKRGYCIHYATAACALYRALGVPSRICDGFLVNAESGQPVSVRGSDAHAWVEVYYDGLGWIPVEVTAGSGESSAQLTVQGMAPQTLVPAQATLPVESAPHESSVLPSGEDAPQEPGQQAVTPQDNGDGRTESTPSGEGPTSDEASSTMEKPAAGHRLLHRFGIALLTLVCIGLAVFGRYTLLRRLLGKKLSAADGRKLAVNLYRQAERVVRYGGEIPEAIRVPAERASFSLHEIGEEELSDSRKALDQLTADTRDGLRSWKKLLFRWWSAND